ncbi:MAG: hypothetical protein AAGA68_05290 [Pseudomonadota bacterium]
MNRTLARACAVALGTTLMLGAGAALADYNEGGGNSAGPGTTNPLAAPAVLATGPDLNADGYLSISADEYGSWGSFEFDFLDFFNPVGFDLQPVAFTSGFFYFERDAGKRELLSTIQSWQDVFGPDDSLTSVITSANVSSDSNGDGVDDTAVSQFEVRGGGTLLRFDLTQTVSASEGNRALVRQDYTITNLTDDAVSFEMVRTFDGDLIWLAGDFGDDEVGTMGIGGNLGTYVYQQEVDAPGDTAVTLSGTSGDVYYGGKNGIEPPDGPPAFGFGTDVQVWDAFGVPDSWRTYIAGVGYETNGNSGAFPPGFTDPADGFVGTEYTVSLAGGASDTITVIHTYGGNEPAGCALNIALDRNVARAGSVVAFDLDIMHNRKDTVRVPFEVSLQTADGRVLASKRSRAQVYRFGDRVQQRGFLELPAIVVPGQYRVVVGINGMQQEIALASQPLRIIR